MFDIEKMASIYKKKKKGIATKEELAYFEISLAKSSFNSDYIIDRIENYIKQESKKI